MVIKNAKFITSAAKAEQFIKPDKPMVAICGKSNVGKSSLINMLGNNGKLAKTSATPGRTRLVNYFDFGEFMLADLPGYGYAKVAKTEKDKWAQTLDDFFKKANGDIAHVFVLIDIRHGATDDDLQLLNMLNFYIVPFTVVFTKADKLSRMQQNEHAKKIADSIYLTKASTIVTSSEKRQGKEELLSKLQAIVDIEKEKKSGEEE